MEYNITNETLQKAVSEFTRTLMRDQKGWKKDKNLTCFEFQIEDCIKRTFEGLNGISFKE